jgi:hypothetical protein
MAAAPVAMMKEARACRGRRRRRCCLVIAGTDCDRCCDRAALGQGDGDRATLGLDTIELVARAFAPDPDVRGKARIGRFDHQLVTGINLLDPFGDLEDRAGALQATGINAQRLGRTFGHHGGWHHQGLAFALNWFGQAVFVLPRDFGGLVEADGVVELVATGQVVDLVIAMLDQDAVGDVAADADLAEDIDLAAFWNFTETAAQIVDRYIDRTRDRADLVLFRCADVDQQIDCCVDLADIVELEDPHVSLDHVASGEAEHVDRVLGR